MAILAATQWQVVPSGSFAQASNSNGGGYDGTNYPGGIDYTLVANTSGSAGGPIISFTTGTTPGNSSVLNDVTAQAFTSSMVGNAVHIVSGAGINTGWYFITTCNSSSAVTVDRNLSSGAGSSGLYKVGGCWTDPQVNAAIAVPGNVINVRGSGSNAPTTNDYLLTNRIALVVGSSSGWIKFLGYNGRPRIQNSGDNIVWTSNNAFLWIENFYLPVQAASANAPIFSFPNVIAKNVVFDQNGFDASLFNQSNCIILDCEFLSSAAVSGTTNKIISNPGRGIMLVNCNFHNLGAGADIISTAVGINIIGSVFSNNKGVNLHITAADTVDIVYVSNNTFDNGLKDGILIDTAAALQGTMIFNNIISNHTVAGKFGINLNFGSAAANALVAPFLNYNDLFNNTTNFNNFVSQIDSRTGITGDLTLDPTYAAQTTQGYNIGTNLKAKGFPPQAFTQSSAALTATQSYVDMGGVQRQEPASSGGSGQLVAGGLVVR